MDALHLWPDEDATCPNCRGAITAATPLIAAQEAALPRIADAPNRRHELMRINADMRPICPHCKAHISAVFHFKERPANICKGCALGSGPDGRSLGLVDGLCSRCTPSISRALNVSWNVGSCPPVPAQPGEVPQGVCLACRGAQGWWDSSGRADSEPKPWRTCEHCKGTGEEPFVPPMDPITALRELRDAIDLRKGHGMPVFKDRAEAYIVLDQADKALAAASEVFSEATIREAMQIMASTPDVDFVRRAIWRDLWFYSGWKRLYRKMERHTDAALARGDAAAAEKYHGSEFMRVDRRKVNCYLRLAAAGFLP